MKKGLAVAFVSLLVLMLPVLINADREGMHGEGSGASCMMSGLDDEQRGKLEDLMMDHRLSTIDLRAEVKKLRLMMKKEFLKSEPSRKELEKLADEISAVQKKLQRNRIEHLLNVKKILNDDQFRHFLKHRWGKNGHRMGKRSMIMPRKIRGRHRELRKGCMHEQGAEEVKQGHKGT